VPVAGGVGAGLTIAYRDNLFVGGVMAEDSGAQIAAMDYEDYRADAAARLKYQIEFAKIGFQSLTLVNGGAIVALFTLVGAKAVYLNDRLLWWAFGAFALGLSLVILAVICAFFSQLGYMNTAFARALNAQARMHRRPERYDDDAPYKQGERWLIGSISTTALSLAAFILGSVFSLAAS
jgi:hypothetical protein